VSLMSTACGQRTLFRSCPATSWSSTCPPAASDLVEREQGTRFRLDGVKSRDLVKVRDRSLWSELAREAQSTVGDPPSAGQS